MIRISLLCALIVVLSSVSVVIFAPVNYSQSDNDDGLWVVPVVNMGYAPMLKNLIDNATNSVYLAMNELSDEPPVKTLLNSLISAHERGVDVQVLYEGDVSIDKYAAEYLSDNGVSVKNESSDIYLHSKLVVIDGKIVYVGSHNWSPYAFGKNNEEGVLIFNSTIGDYFNRYFYDLWANSGATPDIGALNVTDGGMEIKPVYDGYTYSALKNLISSAQNRLDVAMYTMAYYSEPAGNEVLPNTLVNEIVDKKSIAKVILDNHDSGDAYNYLDDNNVDVEYDSSANITHLKMVIADNWVYVGDANWDYSYLDNATHTVGVLIHNASVANFFAGYFNTIFLYKNAPYYIADGFLPAGNYNCESGSDVSINVRVANSGQKTNTTVHIVPASSLTTSIVEDLSWNRTSVYDWKNTTLHVAVPASPGSYVLALTFYSKYHHINYTMYLTFKVSTAVPEFNGSGAVMAFIILVAVIYKHDFYGNKRASQRERRGKDEQEHG